MQFEYDPEQLIEEVKKRPGLWDRDHIDNRSKIVKAKLWPAIVKELMKTNDAEFTNSEARVLELQLRKKWKSIRDCFQKYRVNPTKSRRPYIHFNQLQFLIKGNPSSDEPVEMKVEDSSESDEADSKSTNKRSRDRSFYLSRKKKIRLQPETEESDDNADANEDGEYSELNTVSVEEDNKTNPGNFAFADVSAPKQGSDESDKMFLLSLLPHLRSVPEEFRLNVKLELMQVLRVANDSTSKLKY